MPPSKPIFMSSHRRIAPQPSPSMIAMQAQGLEIPSRGDDIASCSNGPTKNPTISSLPDTLRVTPESPTHSCFTKSSSIYSTDSMDSNQIGNSLDSLETTISQIVEMYTNLIDKIPYEEAPSEIQILQPKAYRDTVVPLLRRRFSADFIFVAPPLPTVAASCALDRTDSSCLKSSYEQAPAFQDFSRNLHRERAKVECVCSPSDFNDPCNASVLCSSHTISPTLAPERPFSFVDAHLDDVLSMVADWRSVSPLSEVDYTTPITLPGPRSSEGVHKHLNQTDSVAKPTQVSTPPLRYIKCEDLQNKSPSPQTLRRRVLLQFANPQHGSARNCRNRSIGPAYSGDQIVESSLGGGLKAIIKGTMKKSQESQGPSQRPETRPEIQRLSATIDNHGQDVQGSNLQAIEQQCWTTGGLESRTAYGHGPVTEATESRSLTRKDETKVWFAKSELSYKQKRSKEKKPDHLDAIQPPSRLTSDENHSKPIHRRTSSSKSAGTVDSLGFQERKRSILTALEEARHSLTKSSAEKRRAKLKESITIIGPTELTIANTIDSGGSLS